MWNRIPKSRFVGYKQFGMGVLDAVAHFNIGNMSTLLIYDKMGMERGLPSLFTIKWVWREGYPPYSR